MMGNTHWILALFLLVLATVQAGTLLGCYKEGNLRSRHFDINPGDFGPEIMTVGACRAMCGAYDFTYSALALGKFCFCGNVLPDVSLKEDATTNCNMDCSGDNSEKCGGVTHVSVYGTGEKITGLAITTDASDSVIQVGTQVNIDVTITSGRDVVYKMDYGDGAGATTPNVTDLMQRTYHTPGEYDILVYANDLNETFQDQVAAVAVRVDAPPGDVEVECDNPLVTHESGDCTVTVWSGTSLALTVNVGAPSPITYGPFSIEDPPLSLAGPPIPAKQSNAGDDTASNYLMMPSQFSQSGKVLAWELYVHDVGNGALTLVIFKPECSNYCYSSNTCTGSCDSSTLITSTCPASAFCMQYAMCDPCTPGGSRYTSYPDKYQVTQSISLTVSSPGYQYIPVTGDDVLVEPGYILGLSHIPGDVQLGLVTVAVDEDDRGYAYASHADDDLVTVSTSSSTFSRHAVRAVASGGSKIHLPFVFETAGNYTLDASAASHTLGGSGQTGSTIIRVLEGVNFTIIEGPMYGTTGQEVEFTLGPHTGNNVFYNWTFGSDEYLETGSSTKGHTFVSLGTYLVNVSAYNEISAKFNTTTVYIEDEVTGLTIDAVNTILGQPTIFTFTLTGGTNYTCDWDYGDGSSIVETDPSATPTGSPTPHTYTYSAVNEFTASVNCSNHVSFVVQTVTFKVQEEITNMRLEKEGADVNTNYQIVILIDAGTDVTCTLNFDSALVSLTKDSSLQWTSVTQTGSTARAIPLDAQCSNLVSNGNVTIDFKILSRIVNPTLTIEAANVSSHTNVTFTVDMDSGSEVTVDIAYQDSDGNTDTYTQPAGVAWAAPYDFFHQYTEGGRFDVTATFSNPEGTFVKSEELLVLVGVASINCVMEKYSLYHPPAEYSLTLEGDTLPTEPQLTIDWADSSTPITPNLVLNEPYNHTFRDTGVFRVTASLVNLMGTKNCTQDVTVVEKLNGPDFAMELTDAAQGQPFEVKFCLFRGPSGNLCNLTFDFGNGETTTVQRTGSGQNGCDVQTVTYSDSTPKTVAVTATTPLESITESVSVNIITAATDSEIIVTVPPINNYGSPMTFAIEYSGSSTVATNITIDYGDGSTPTTTSYTFTGAATTNVAYNYPNDGVFDAVVTVGNDAFKVVRNISVGVYQLFSSPTAAVYYEKEIPAGQKDYGYNNDGTSFPIGKSIFFEITDGNNAYADSYELTLTGNTLPTIVETFDTSLFSFNITQHDQYTAVVKVTNSRDTKSTSPININTIKFIEGLNVVEAQAKVKVNEEKVFDVSFDSINEDDTCVYVDYDNGLKEIFTKTSCVDSNFPLPATTVSDISNVYQLKATYTSEQYYEITVRAENPYSNQSQTVGFSITNLDCTKPNVDIFERKPVFTEPEVYTRSQHIKIRGLSEISCGTSYENTKTWFVDKMDPLMNTVINPPVVITDITDTPGKAELNIPKRFLPIGLYRVTYKMEMVGDFGPAQFASTTDTYLEVTASPLVAIMVPGGNSFIRRGQLQTLELDPADLSLDPDLDPSEPQAITASTWACTTSDSSLNGCDEVVDTPGKKTLTLANMDVGVYAIEATLTKNTTRTAKTTINLEVTEGAPPVVTIVPMEGSVVFQESDGYKILKSSSLRLVCICEDCSEAQLATIEYTWSVYLRDYRWPNERRPLTQDEVKDRIIGEHSKVISLSPDLFGHFDSTSIILAECNITRNGDIGSVSTTLKVNSPPAGGTCIVTPYNRTFTQDTAWNVAISGWADLDGIAEYQLYVHTSDDEIERQITSIIESSDAFAAAVSLTEALGYNDYKEEVFLNVRDKLGSITRYSCGDVVVRPIPLDQIQALSSEILNNELSDMQRLFAEGDQSTCTERSISLFSTLNSASKRSQSEYAGYRQASNFAGSMYGQRDVGRPSYQQISELQNDPEEAYEMEHARDTRAQLKKTILDSLATLETESVIAMQQVSSCYAEAVIYSDEIVPDAQKSIMNAIEGMIDRLSDVSNLDDTPPEDVAVFLRNAVAAIGGVTDAVGGNGFFPTLNDLEEAQGDEMFFEYETSMDAGEDPEMEAVNTFDEALALQKARVHKQRQAKVSYEIRQKSARALDKFAAIFNYMSVPSEDMEIKTLKMKMSMKKSDEANLKGQSLTVANSVGGVQMPNISFLNSNGTDESFILSVAEATNYPIRYSEYGLGRISNSTTFITINIYSEDNSKMTVNSVEEPFKITIPLDANMEQPSYIDMDPIIVTWNNLMSFKTVINYTHSALFMDFGKLAGRQLMLVVKKGEEPKILSDQADDKCDNVFLVPPSMTEDLDDPFRYRFFFGNDFLGNFTGDLYVGVRELNTTEYDMDLSNSCYSLPRYPNGSDYFRGNFTMRQYVAQCLAIGDSDADWSSDGCYVGKETDSTATVCYCSHMTTFAGGWVVVPNTIDWSYVFANADFLSNPTIYVTQIVIVVFFIIAAIYARYKDKKLKEKLGIAPLLDNDPKDKYFYEIIVCTGMRRNAGTDSQVCFILSGEDDETEIRAFSDEKRKIFRRGQMDGFLMSVARPLGYLNFIRIWHDNSGKGKFGSWYLNYMVVRDIQTGAKQVFVCNKWFAVEEDDGQVDRVIPVSGKEQLADFSYQFGERTRKNLADGHLWFSVVARPPQSRFTCLQRVSCILCLLYVTMLANAMFYNTPNEDEQSSNTFAFGPFSVSPEQIYIGVISNLIVFPVNFLLIFLFRKSRPHHKRPSRIDMAMKEVTDQGKQTSINDVKPEVSSIFSVSKTPTLPHDLRGPDTSRPNTAMSMTNERTPLDGKKKKCELPWYFVIISWIILCIVTLGAAFMVTFYGISFKDEVCQKWISSMLISFFMSVFITQPIKVFLFAIILSLIIKNPGEEKEDEEDDEEVHITSSEDALLHEDDNGFGAARPRKIGYKPPDPAVVEKHRIRRLKEIKMWSIIREVIMYVFFLWILMVISYSQLGASHFLYKDTMHRVFIANNDTQIDFHKIRNTNEYWTWARSGLMNGLRAGSYYNDYPPLKLRTYVNDKVSRILGYATLRQVRIRPGLCEIPDEMKGIIPQCNLKYHILDQEESNFRPRWLELRDNETASDARPEYKYSDASTLNGYPYWGQLAWYSGGGYVLPLTGSKQEIVDKLSQLQNEDWIDKYTRAVFVEFTVYNPQVNLFAIGTILAEFHPSGGMVHSYRFEPAMLLPYMDNAMLFQLVCEIVFMIFTLYFIIHELREFIRMRLSYFKSFWNLVEVLIISMSLTAIVIFFYRLFLTKDLTKDFKETQGKGYVKFQYVAYWNETFSYIIGMLVFCSTLKFLKLLRFNKKITLLSATLNHSAKSLLHFSIIFGIVFLAFAQLFYLTYMNIDIDYSTFISSVVASVLMMMGKFNIYTMIMAEPVLTQIFVLLFVVSVTFIIVNMFVSILNETFTTVREDIKKQGNDYEIVDFMVHSFRKWTGIGGVPQENEEKKPSAPDNKEGNNANATGPDYIQDFPDRIDRLLQSISAVYTDNDNFAKMYQKKAFESGSASNPKGFMPTSSRNPPQAHSLTNRRRESSDAIARVHTH